ncbi:MAG: SDR family oxidoreductase [Firmicutes bacterium]|nr:SDR family oxidoreductase [Bacillota bacterium]
MKHLIIGASGQVGSAFYRYVEETGQVAVGTYFKHAAAGLVALDMTDRLMVKELMETVRPDVVWLPAALPDVDWCEREPELSYRLNVEAAVMTAEMAQEAGARTGFISTDYVFDGVGGPFDESRARHPLQVYGRHKAEAEQKILERDDRALIIRPAWIYSAEANPRNFVYRMLQQLAQKKPVNAAVDQWSTPTPSKGLARMAVKALDEGFAGVLHIVGDERLTRYDLTRKIAQWSGFPLSQVHPVKLAELDLPAKRPLDGGLTSRYREFLVEPEWPQVMAEMESAG